MLYCEAFLTTYRTFISPEELIKKLQYRYPSPPMWPSSFLYTVSEAVTQDTEAERVEVTDSHSASSPRASGLSLFMEVGPKDPG